MKRTVLILFAVVAACRDQQPPAPTAEEAEQLNEAEALLNEMDQKEGPADRSTGPSNKSD